MTKKYKILFLGETYRAYSITWMDGVKEFGPFEIDTWELVQAGKGLNKVKRGIEMILRFRELKRKVLQLKPDLIFADRVTSYGFIGTSFHKYAPVVVSQQGITDIYPPDSFMVPIKRMMEKYAFKHACLIHAWGEIMTYNILKKGADVNKIMVLNRGIDLRNFPYTTHIKDEKIRAIVTRSLTEDYRHETILKAFEIIKQQKIPFVLIIIGDGRLKEKLIQSAIDKNIQHEVIFTGSIPNTHLPKYLSDSDLYISMPCTEGVSASLFEAMSAGCYPIVTDVPGNRAWITDKINGRLIPVDDVQKLATAIKWYADNRLELKDVLLKNRKIVEQKASYEKNMKIICNKYLELIENSHLCAV